MRFSNFVKNLFISYRTFFRLFFRTFFTGKNTQARLTLKRFFIMTGFLPVLFALQTFHWLGFLLDEVFFRGYRSAPVRAPVFIVGVPRSGTTFLHRLLARDKERFCTFALWEMILAPSVCERKFWLGLGRLDRILGAPFARLIRWLENRVFAGLENIHRISLTDEEEDYFLLAPIYACFLLILPFPFPEELGDLACFDDKVPKADQERIMDFYKACLKRHLYVKGAEKTFLSKNVAFSPMIRALKDAFPDCRIIATVRNPVNAVPSHISSMMTGAAIFDNNVRKTAFRDQMIEVQRYAYTHILETLGDNRGCEMIACMEDLQSHLASTIRAAYQTLGFQITPEFEQYIRDQDRRQKAYQSMHHYDLAAYGLTEADIYKRFHDIFEKIGCPLPAGGKDPWTKTGTASNA